MSIFKSNREKRLWLFTLVVLLAIFATLIFGWPLARFLRSKGLLTIGFIACLSLVVLFILLHGLQNRAGKSEVVVWLGIVTVYLLVLLRMAIPEERGHLIEYSVLAIFIHEALRERASQGGQISSPWFMAFLLTVLVGVLDESIQLFMPNRVFDPFDILFNTLAAFLAIGSSLVLFWVRTKVRKL